MLHSTCCWSTDGNTYSHAFVAAHNVLDISATLPISKPPTPSPVCNMQCSCASSWVSDCSDFHPRNVPVKKKSSRTTVLVYRTLLPWNVFHAMMKTLLQMIFYCKQIKSCKTVLCTYADILHLFQLQHHSPPSFNQSLLSRASTIQCVVVSGSKSMPCDALRHITPVKLSSAATDHLAKLPPTMHDACMQISVLSIPTDSM